MYIFCMECVIIINIGCTILRILFKKAMYMRIDKVTENENITVKIRVKIDTITSAEY